MILTPRDLALLTEEITALKTRLETNNAASGKVLAVLGGIESALSDAAEAIDKATSREPDDRMMKELVRAISALKLTAPEINMAPVFNVPPSPPPTVEMHPIFNVPPAPERTAPAWSSIRVEPKRDARTGEVLEYIIKRIA